MTATPNLPCPRCGAPTVPGPAGLCPACLMKMGLESRAGAPEVVFTKEGGADRPAPPTIEELAPHFPELELREFVGRGGAGAVYRARQRSLERDVALKVLTIAPDQNFAERFQREAHTLAGLSHPGIVSVFEYGQRGPWAFLVMEFVDGASLRQMLRAREMGAREALSIVSQTCDALQYAHDHGVVHRDIKPENILVTRDGRVKVLDFGLAKLVGGASRENLTRDQQVMGTPHYMAPEQWEKPQTVDHRADIYALGVVFYELLTGELPIGRFAPPSHKVTLDVRLDDVVLRSLEKEPDRRYQHASDVKDAVTGIGASPPPPPFTASSHAAAAPSSVVSTARPEPRSKVFWIAALGCGAILLGLFVVGVFVLFLGGQRSFDAQSATQRAAEANVREVVARNDQIAAATERARAQLSLSIEDDTPALSPVTAQKLGLDAPRRDRLNAALLDVWRRYLALETAHVTIHTDPPKGIFAKVEPFPEERGRLLREAYDAIQSTLWTDNVAKEWEETVRGHVDRMMRLGAEEERIRILQRGEDFEVGIERPGGGRKDATGTVSFGTTSFTLAPPLGSWVRRVWELGRTSAIASDTRNPDELGLSVDDERLWINDFAAAKLGLSAGGRTRLDAALATAWNEYVELESNQVDVAQAADGAVDVVVRIAVARRDRCLRRAFDAIHTTLVTEFDAQPWEDALRAHVERMMRFGSVSERLRLRKVDGTCEVDTVPADDLAKPAEERRYVTVPPPHGSWVSRAWARAHPLDKQPWK